MYELNQDPLAKLLLCISYESTPKFVVTCLSRSIQQMPWHWTLCYHFSLLTWTLGHEDTSHVLLCRVIPSQPHPDNDGDNDDHYNNDSDHFKDDNDSDDHHLVCSISLITPLYWLCLLPWPRPSLHWPWAGLCTSGGPKWSWQWLVIIVMIG